MVLVSPTCWNSGDLDVSNGTLNIRNSKSGGYGSGGGDAGAATPRWVRLTGCGLSIASSDCRDRIRSVSFALHALVLRRLSRAHRECRHRSRLATYLKVAADVVAFDRRNRNRECRSECGVRKYICIQILAMLLS
jgi:hypothetical protein